jgi:hypothetical protein
MKPFDRVKITKCTNPQYMGFEGELHTNLKSFHANAGIFPMIDVLMIDKNESCIGIIGNDGAFWWTKNSDFDVEIQVI